MIKKIDSVSVQGCQEFGNAKKYEKSSFNWNICEVNSLYTHDAYSIKKECLKFQPVFPHVASM